MWGPFLAGLLAFGLGVGAGFWAVGPPLGAGLVTPLALEARALPLDREDPGRRQVGRLRFLGALALESRELRFGGISALLHDPACRRLLAVTDSGSWLILEPREEGDQLTGVSAAWIAPVLDAAGRAPTSKLEADAEELATDGPNLFVWFERRHRAQRYSGLSPCNPDSLAKAADEVIRLPEMASWPPNGGAEAAAILGRDWILFPEEGDRPGGSAEGLILGPGGVRRFLVSLPDGFLPTAADAIDPDRLILVARRFARLAGVAAEIRMVELPAPGEEVARTTLLARLEPPLLVDNMEAGAVRRDGDRIFLYLASDDNFNRAQRTLLMKFELLPDPPTAE